MAQPHYSTHEATALYSGIESAAKRWAQLFDFAEGSELKKAYEDPDYFKRIAEGEYAGRVAPLAHRERQQVDATRASAYARGVGGFGAVEKRVAEIGAGGVAQRSAIRAELEASAERSRVENEGQWFEMLGQIGQAEQSVIGAQHQLARRLGEQAAYDPDYKEDRFYQPHGPFSQRFFDYFDWVGEYGKPAEGGNGGNILFQDYAEDQYIDDLVNDWSDPTVPVDPWENHNPNQPNEWQYPR